MITFKFVRFMTTVFSIALFGLGADVLTFYPPFFSSIGYLLLVGGIIYATVAVVTHVKWCSTSLR